jgi:hypothetical protein
MTATAYIVHKSRGRMRLQVREMCKDQAYFETAREQLEDVAGIDEVSVNSITGSIVLLHSLDSHEQLTGLLRQLPIFDLSEARFPEASAFTPLRSGLSGIEALLKSGTASSIDLRTVAFIGMMGLTLHQILRGQVLGPALPMLWNAFSLIDRTGSSAQDSSTGDSGPC